MMVSFEDLTLYFEKEFRKEILTFQHTEPFRLFEPISYSLSAGGKRIRPVLLLHAASLYSDQYQDAYPAAAAIELFHNFTLLHDDIMDHAEIRRGRPSVHVRFGSNSAILSGDAMSILAFQLLSKCPAGRLHDLLDLFSTTALEVCQGQQYDMEFEDSDEVGIDDYLEMIRLKTAVLIGCSLKMGAIVAGAPDTDSNLLYDFGLHTGVAFQLQDDWLDVYGNESSFGKKIGGDICENKKTFLLLKALETRDPGMRSALKEWLSGETFDPKEKITAVTEIYTRTGAAEAARGLMKHHHDLALAALDRLAIPEPDKSGLRTFVAGLLDRAS